MKNADVVDSFLRDGENRKGSNLVSENGVLVNYTTVIALRHPMGIVLNEDDYSRTTAVHQNRIRRSGVEYIATTEKGINGIRYTGHTTEPNVFSRNGKPLEDEDM